MQTPQGDGLTAPGPNHPARASSPSHQTGISRNHAFPDGNKRTGFLAAVLFCSLNGHRINAPHPDCVRTMLGVASGEIAEAAFAQWIRDYLQMR